MRQRKIFGDENEEDEDEDEEDDQDGVTPAVLRLRFENQVSVSDC